MGLQFRLSIVVSTRVASRGMDLLKVTDFYWINDHGQFSFKIRFVVALLGVNMPHCYFFLIPS
jgi:hypothetical protein